jgi:preprotein translocase subunit SecF
MKTVAFTKSRFLFIALSIVLILGGLAATIGQRGLNLGIDFQAGLSIRVQVDPNAASAGIESVRVALSDIDGATVQTIGTAELQEFTIRVRDSGEIDSFSTVMSSEILGALEAEFGSGTITELENTYVGPRFSETLTRNMILLTSMALILILAYIWIRFRLAYAVASIVALLHDVSFMIVFVGAFQIEVSTATVAAVLTIIGYSLNDTIVIFDRIRENERIMRDTGLELTINTSITQSLSRTLITSLTTLLAASAIFVFATGQVQLFALNLMIGVIIGTYSSIFIASPVLLGLRNVVKRRERKRSAERHGAPMIARPAGEIADASPTPVSAAEKQKILDEISRKRASSAGRSSSRAKRKKK